MILGMIFAELTRNQLVIQIERSAKARRLLARVERSLRTAKVFKVESRDNSDFEFAPDTALHLRDILAYCEGSRKIWRLTAL